MGVIFTGEAEKRRQQALQEARASKPSKKWEYLSTTSEAEAVRFARDHGWAQNKVQVKANRINEEEWEYSVEPYEDCGCPNLLQFDHYFDRDTE